MGTVIRPEVSSKKEYWISRHRYYELKHFCLQYGEWKQAYNSITMLSSSNLDKIGSGSVGDPVADIAEQRLFYKSRMELVERLTKEADPTLWNYIFVGVTEGISYEIIRARMDCPCCREIYYETYRRFFWLLHKERN